MNADKRRSGKYSSPVLSAQVCAISSHFSVYDERLDHLERLGSCWPTTDGQIPMILIIFNSLVVGFPRTENRELRISIANDHLQISKGLSA
jgi:hypothetical protein